MLLKPQRKELVHGVGVNDSDYVTKSCPFYKAWVHVLERVYSRKLHDTHPTYMGTALCEEWKTFSVFKKWMAAQDWEGKALDKDLLVYGNKSYAPEFCIFIPKKLNSLLAYRRRKNSGNPTGVYDVKDSSSYKVMISLGDESKYLGVFDSVQSASSAYLTEKIRYIRKTAHNYDKKVCAALNRHADILSTELDDAI